MPKQEKNRPISFGSRTRAYPYPCSSSSSHHRASSSSNPHLATPKDMKKWDEIRCSVCMEHPHNAVLLTCSSGNKGCQPFMCDTSYRHSNCLDQYKKAFSELLCPLCRGSITGWLVDESARIYMNSKTRSCSKESCGFNGTYLELRKHARKEHPTVTPSEADPDRQQSWQRMERSRDIGDLISTIRGVMDNDEDGGGYESMFEDNGFEFDNDEVGSGRIFQISPVAVLFFIRYRRMERGSEDWASPSGSPSPVRVPSRYREWASPSGSRSPVWAPPRHRRSESGSSEWASPSISFSPWAPSSSWMGRGDWGTQSFSDSNNTDVVIDDVTAGGVGGGGDGSMYNETNEVIVLTTQREQEVPTRQHPTWPDNENGGDV